MSLLAAASVSAQPDREGGAAQGDIDEQVAEALYQRGLVLFQQGDYENAKKLFIESLERSATGPRSKDALRLLRSSNERLGFDDLDAGRPGTGGAPLDPYGDPDPGAAPLDPYGDPDPGTAPLDPYGDPGTAVEVRSIEETERETAQRTLLFWGGAYGFTTGLALAGPQDEVGSIGGVPFLVGALSAGAGAGLSYFWFDRYPMTPGQAAATASGGFWGAATFGLIGDVILFYASDSEEAGNDTNALYKFVAAGGLVGTGLGGAYAYRASPGEGEVAFVNSLSLYGASLGLLLGVTIDPPQSQAYSLQAAIGSLIGLGTGVYLAERAGVSRRRMLWVDLGAAAGAAVPWALVYPLVSDSDSSKDEQAIGFVSSLTMVGGAVAAWLLTRGLDREPEPLAAEAGADRTPPPPALLQREQSGRWRVGVPVLRPVEDPALAPPARSLGLDLFSGRF
jgi:hypothetical protein